MLDGEARYSDDPLLRYVRRLNGDFALCPRCGDVMCRGLHAHGPTWVCMFGCGWAILEYPQRMREGERP